jgi:hypothetical protein
MSGKFTVTFAFSAATSPSFLTVILYSITSSVDAVLSTFVYISAFNSGPFPVDTPTVGAIVSFAIVCEFSSSS